MTKTPVGHTEELVNSNSTVLSFCRVTHNLPVPCVKGYLSRMDLRQWR